MREPDEIKVRDGGYLYNEARIWIQHNKGLGKLNEWDEIFFQSYPKEFGGSVLKAIEETNRLLGYDMPITDGIKEKDYI